MCVCVCVCVCVYIYMKELVKTSIFVCLVHGVCVLSFYCVCQQFLMYVKSYTFHTIGSNTQDAVAVCVS